MKTLVGDANDLSFDYKVLDGDPNFELHKL